MKPKLLRLWTKFAREVADLSSCERTKVGAVLLSLDGERVLSYGYNGTWRGGPNTPEDYVGTPAWVHAEANALVKTRPVEPFILLTTHTPCIQCAMLTINAEAVAVLALEPYRDLTGWNLLCQAYGSDPAIGDLTIAEYCTPARSIRRGAFMINEES